MASVSTERPTKVRYGVVFFAVTLAVITYIDRVALGLAAPQINRDLHLDKKQMGYVFFAFLGAYSLFEIPSGFLGDKLGARRVLMRIVVWWSCFVAATGQAWNLISLFTIQTLFGVGEAGCFPNIAKAFSVWLPRDERTRAQGIVWLSARWGGAVTPLIVYFTFQFVTWRVAFLLFGCLGCVWAVFFYRWFRDNPRDKKSVNAAELALLGDLHPKAHGPLPWKKFLASKQVWLLCGQYFCLSYSWYFSITWLPTYLKEARHLDPNAGSFAILAGLPLFLGGIGAITSGFLTKAVSRVTGSINATRKLLGCVGLLGACTLMATSTLYPDPVLAVISLALASFCNDITLPGAWASAMDVGGDYAGTLSGTMNMMGNFGGAMASFLAPHILSAAHENWNAVIYLAAGIYFVGTFFWVWLDTVTPLDMARSHSA